MEDIENSSFSDSPCTLDLSCSSSSFEWSDCSDGAAAGGVDKGLSGAAVEPYMYEPEVSESSLSAGDSSSEDSENRLGNMEW